MKKIILLLFVTANVFGQNVDYNKIILPNHVQTPDFAEKLVQLAWQNNPQSKILQSEINIGKYQIKRNAAEWLDIIGVQGNVNEFTLNPSADNADRADFYPKYNIRAAIRFGMFVDVPLNTKIDREELVKAEQEVNLKKLEIRNTVMKLYNEYLLAEKIYKIQAQLFSDIENAHKIMEQKFKNGETTFENYSTSQANYSRASITLLDAETDFKNLKLDIEKWIGIPLEDVQ